MGSEKFKDFSNGSKSPRKLKSTGFRDSNISFYEWKIPMKKDGTKANPEKEKYKLDREKGSKFEIQKPGLLTSHMSTKPENT